MNVRRARTYVDHPPPPESFKEAPLDGRQYGRQNADWTLITVGAMDDYVLKTGDTMTGNLIIQRDPMAGLMLSGDRFCALDLARDGSARWVLGCSHFSEAGYPFGLYFARMSADGTALQDFPFAIRRGDGRVVMTWADIERAFKTGNLTEAELNEFITRAWFENATLSLPYVNRAGDTMTGTLYMTGGGIIVENNLDAALRLAGREASTIGIRSPDAPRWLLGSHFRSNDPLPDNFTISRIKDLAGLDADIPLQIRYSDGKVSTETGDPVTDNDLARKAYVDARVIRAGDIMTGPLSMGAQRLFGVPTPVDDDDAANKDYVDSIVVQVIHYQGTWQVAANIPDLSAFPAVRGDFFIAVTADPAIPEEAPAGIPGLAGTMITEGDWIIWNDNQDQWERIRGGLGLTRPEADALYVKKLGDQMEGSLLFNQPEIGVNWNNRSSIREAPDVGLILRRSLNQDDLFTENVDGIDRQPLLTEARGDERYLKIADGIRDWTLGASYNIGQYIRWDGLPFVVTASIAVAPATPDFSTIRLAAASQGDYWQGFAQGWVTGNWILLATLPAYGTYRYQIDSLVSQGDASYMLDITTSYNNGAVTITSRARNPNGEMFSQFRLSSAGAAAEHRLEAQIRTQGAGAELKLFITGFARQSNSNTTSIPRPPTGQTANQGGTEHALIFIPPESGATLIAKSMAVTRGGYIRCPHANEAGGDDGRIGARLFSPGLNIVGSRTEADDPTGAISRKISIYGTVEMMSTTPIISTEFRCKNDGTGINFFGGSWIYKAVGSSLVIRSNSLQIENLDQTNRRPIIDQTTGDARYVRQSGADLTITETSRYRWAMSSNIGHQNTPFFTGQNGVGSLFEWRVSSNNNSATAWLSLWLADAGGVLRELFVTVVGNPPIVNFRARPQVNGSPMLIELEADARYLQKVVYEEKIQALEARLAVLEERLAKLEAK